MATETQGLTNSFVIRSRIGWGAIFGGVFVAFAIMLVLNALGIAVGLSAGNQSLGWGAGIWAIIVALVALFVGGWVMSFMETHETNTDAALHGVVLWGILLFGMLVLTVSGLQFGITALMGSATSLLAQNNVQQLLNTAQSMGLTDAQIAELQEQIMSFNFPAAASAWWSFLAMIVSLGAVVWGAVVGSHHPGDERTRAMRLREQQHPVG